VTYHGPGQLVVYLMLDLRRRRLGVRTLVRTLEASVVEFLDSLGVFAYGKPSAPGVYVTHAGNEAKIAALGLKVRNGCTYHGLALNVDMDLSPFAAIDPCGYPGLAVTSLAELRVPLALEDAGARLAQRLTSQLIGAR
jgi:lipoyl(octanoyl) transferase